MSGDQFLTWGWRVPFLLSIVLIALGLYIRLGILETPVFADSSRSAGLSVHPSSTVIRRHPREIILTALCRMAEQAPFYLFTAFVFAYGTGMLHLDRDFLLMAVLAAAMLSFVSIPLFGHLVRPLWTQASIHARRGSHRDLWLCVFHSARHESAVLWWRSPSCSRWCRTT